MEMDREPKNAQVVTQGTSENSVIFLVDENGVICKYDSRECTTHVSQPVDTERDDPPGESNSALRSKDSKLTTLRESLEAQNQELIEGREALHQAQETLQNEQQRGRQQEAELGESKAVLEKEKRRVTRIWREKCDLQLSHEDAMDAKDVDIARLKARLLVVTSPAAVSPQTVPSPGDRRVDETSLVPLQHRKAPPINPFSAEGLDEQWDEWLPTFERAAEWNNWSDTVLTSASGSLGW